MQAYQLAVFMCGS